MQLRKEFGNVGFEILTAVLMRSSIFWDIARFNRLKVNRRFEGTSLFNLASIAFCKMHHAGSLLGLFDPEDVGVFLQKVVHSQQNIRPCSWGMYT
jgi:hypothetical protein